MNHMSIEEIAKLERQGRRSIRNAMLRNVTAESFAEEAAETSSDELVRFTQELVRYMGFEVVNKIGMNTVTAPFLVAAFLLEAEAIIVATSKGNTELEQHIRQVAENLFKTMHAASSVVTMRVRDERM